MRFLRGAVFETAYFILILSLPACAFVGDAEHEPAPFEHHTERRLIIAEQGVTSGPRPQADYSAYPESLRSTIQKHVSGETRQGSVGM
jgi:hypothetical protein